MYTDIGSVPDEVLLAISDVEGEVVWTHFGEDRDYWTGRVKRWPIDCIDDSTFFLKIEPGGFVHRHRDNRKDYDTIHIPVQTNPFVVHSEWRESEPVEHTLSVGRMYLVDRTVEHATENHGDTARIHLLMAQPKDWSRCLSLRS